MPTSEEDYKKLISEMIKKQILILGSEITLSKIKGIQGLTVTDAGDVTAIQGEPQKILQDIINAFVDLSGLIVKKTMESILVTYPGMIGIAAQGAFGVTAPQPSASPAPATPTVLAPLSAPAPQKEEVAKVEPPKEAQAPAPFAASDMSDLDKALDALANSPLGVTPPPVNPSAQMSAAA